MRRPRNRHGSRFGHRGPPLSICNEFHSVAHLILRHESIEQNQKSDDLADGFGVGRVVHDASVFGSLCGDNEVIVILGVNYTPLADAIVDVIDVLLSLKRRLHRDCNINPAPPQGAGDRIGNMLIEGGSAGTPFPRSFSASLEGKQTSHAIAGCLFFGK